MGRGGEEAATKDEEEGWYDDDGFWFEPAADGSAGFYDCYDPEGQLHETGSYTDAGEWVKAEGSYDAHGRWAPAEIDPYELPGQVAPAPAPAPGAAREPPPPRAAGLVLETNDDGEQGYFHKGKWICTGWYDADGFWFEEAGQPNENDEFVANGYYDCYGPEGDWAETGYWGDGDTWVNVPGYYDDGGNWVDDDPPVEEAPKAAPKPKPKPAPKAKSKVKFESDEEEDPDGVYKGELHLGKGGKKGKKSGGKYAVEEGKGGKGGGKAAKEAEAEPSNLVNGEPILICDMSGAKYKDTPWAVLFLLTVGATAFLAVYKNFMGGTQADLPGYCDSQPCLNGATCTELNVVVESVGGQGAGRVGFECECAPGWMGDTCDVAPCGFDDSCDDAQNATAVEVEESSLHLTDSQLHNFVAMSIAAVGGGTAWGLGFLQIVRNYTSAIVKTTLAMMVIVQLGMAAVSFAMGISMLGIICTFAAAFSVLIVVVVRNWIPFATLLINTACIVVQKYPAVVKIALLAVISQAIWLAIWTYAATSSIGSSDSLATFLCLVSLFWSVQVIKNVVHVTCAGTMASWYFMTNERNPTLAAFRRSLTFSLGSICLGSLVVAILRSLRAMLPRRTSMAMNGGFSSMFLVAMLGCIERLMEWLNHYAFTQIAIYGYDFKEAAKATWRLLQDVGLMPMMNNTLVQGVCYFGCFIGAAISALISVMFVKQTDLDGTLPMWTAATFGAMLGFVMVVPIIEVVESMVTALFICYAYNADVLMLNDPELYTEISKAYETMVSDMGPQGEDVHDKKRVDPSDGNAYTREEFIEAYGGTDEWDAAAPGSGGGGDDDEDWGQQEAWGEEEEEEDEEELEEESEYETTSDEEAGLR